MNKNTDFKNSKKVKFFWKKSGYTQIHLANYLKINIAHFSMKTNLLNKCRFTDSQLLKLAKIFKVNKNEFIYQNQDDKF